MYASDMLIPSPYQHCCYRLHSFLPAVRSFTWVAPSHPYPLFLFLLYSHYLLPFMIFFSCIALRGASEAFFFLFLFKFCGNLVLLFTLCFAGRTWFLFFISSISRFTSHVRHMVIINFLCFGVGGIMGGGWMDLGEQVGL